MRARLIHLARSRRVRVALAICVVLVVVVGAAQIWMSGPDAVHIVVTRHEVLKEFNGAHAVIYDKTLTDTAIAQRLQRDVAATRLFLSPPNAVYSCATQLEPRYSVALTWSRNGVTVETATYDGSGCRIWTEDGFLPRAASAATDPASDVLAVIGMS